MAPALELIPARRLRNLLLILLAGFFATSTESIASIEQQRQLFHDAAFALERNQIKKFNRLLKQLADYPAKPYLEYDHLPRA